MSLGNLVIEVYLMNITNLERTFIIAEIGINHDGSLQKLLKIIVAVLSSNFVNLSFMKKFKFREIKKVPFKNNIKNVIFQFTLNDWLKWKEYLKNECVIKDR